MGKDIARRHAEFQARLVRYAQELGAEMFPEGLVERMTFSDLERAAVAAGDEVARMLVERRGRARTRSQTDRQSQARPK